MQQVEEEGKQEQDFGLRHTYRFIDEDFNETEITEADIPPLLFLDRPNTEVVRRYYTNRVIVDGIRYDRYHTISYAAMFTFKPDQAHLPDKHVFWDSKHECLHHCQCCGKAWQMDESFFLKMGHIRCAHCGMPGATAGSQWW